MLFVLVDADSAEVLEARLLPADIQRQDILDALDRWLWRNHRITLCEECGHYFHESDLYEVYDQIHGEEQPPYLLCESCLKSTKKKASKGG